MRKEVTFKNNGFDMAGLLFLPEEFDGKGKKYAAVVCVHPGGGVKEQTAGIYAQKLANHGFIALAFDASHQGESGGLPRYLESPTARVGDIRCAIDYLVTLPYVDEEQIGALGICAGGGYVVNAACTDRRIKALAGISSVDIGAFMRDGLGKTNSAKSRIATLDAVAQQRTAEARGADPLYVGYVGDKSEFTEDTPTLWKEGYDYYRTSRGRHPNSTNKMLFTSTDELMGFTAFAPVHDFLRQPLLLIAGSEADTRYFSEEVFELATTEDKELFLIDGATHIALYDVPEYVDQASGKIRRFFAAKLREPDLVAVR